ncbi:uncharacterized protein [Rutidosis leptorrhynchoides]|uniref:uncharacterized protein n=1 Tax=Rutidosis leptorrhynchoides TaxID=125765 RepID=UPI003A98D645
MASAEKVTVMILEVDLKCSSCYKKVRKLLCKFPEIRDQMFDVDKNKVRITVVCCDPEKLRDKLCCKGGRAIQSIEIVEKPKQLPSKPPDENTPKELENSMPKDPKTPRPSPHSPKKKPMGEYPFCPPVSTCCQECYQGLDGGPCHYGYGRPVPPPPGPCYDGYYHYGGNRPCYVSRCDYYFSEDNPQGCSIM